MDTKRLATGLCAGVFGLFLTGAAAQQAQPRDGDSAQAQQQNQGQTQAQSEQASAKGIRASNIIGSQVVNDQGQTLGTIKDVVLDRRGEVAYLALDPSKELGIGEKLIQAPWHAFSAAAPEKGRLLLPMSAEQLAQAPSFEQNQWPLADDREMRAALDRYYLVVAAPMLRKVSFSELDSDGDGSISLQEAREAEVLYGHFRTADEDGDGSISKAEFAAFEQAVEQVRSQGAKGAGQPPMQQPQQTPQMQQPGGQQSSPDQGR